MIDKIFYMIFVLYFGNLLAIETPYEFNLFDLEDGFPSDCDKNNHCYSLSELVTQTIESGLDTREKILEYYQAHKNAHVTGMLLLPEVNLKRY